MRPCIAFGILNINLTAPTPCRLRLSLGLKPLNLEAPKQRVEERKPPPEEAKPDEDAIRAKLAE